MPLAASDSKDAIAASSCTFSAFNSLMARSKLIPDARQSVLLCHSQCPMTLSVGDALRPAPFPEFTVQIYWISRFQCVVRLKLLTSYTQASHPMARCTKLRTTPKSRRMRQDFRTPGFVWRFEPQSRSSKERRNGRAPADRTTASRTARENRRFVPIVSTRNPGHLYGAWKLIRSTDRVVYYLHPAGKNPYQP